MPSGSLNKGEWGELYVFLRLVGDGLLTLSDAREVATEGPSLEIIEVIRKETADRTVTYTLDGSDVDVYVDGEYHTTRPRSDFSARASEVLAYVLDHSGSRTLDIPESLRSFLDGTEVQHYKASAASKSDIWLTTRDPRTGTVMEGVGYSVKTKWARRSTLFNTGSGSRSIYIIEGMNNDTEADLINSIVDAKGNADVKGRMGRILENGYSLIFDGYTTDRRTGVQIFPNNCSYISDSVPEMWRTVVMEHFLDNAFSGSHRSMEDVCEWLAHANPCRIPYRPEDKYRVFLKNFLFSAYCGLTASKYWDGVSDVNGGLIVVKADGDVVAFTSLDSATFRDYLFNNCSMDWPSTSRGHGDYGTVYREDGVYKIALNFQIRF